jgi:hypothetical protein
MVDDSQTGSTTLMRHLFEPGACMAFLETAVPGHPHTCVIERWHWGAHLCVVCGLLFNSFGVIGLRAELLAAVLIRQAADRPPEST